MKVAGEGVENPPSVGGMGNFTKAGFFYQVVGVCWGVHLTILKVKEKKYNSVNIKHQIKSKLAWPVCIRVWI